MSDDYTRGFADALDQLRPQIEHITELLDSDEAVLASRVLELENVLRFYADPDSYFAIFIQPDRPAGGFADDFSDVDTDDAEFVYDRPMPGALAREVLGVELPQQRKRDYYG